MLDHVLGLRRNSASLSTSADGDIGGLLIAPPPDVPAPTSAVAAPQWWRNVKHDDLATSHGDVMIFYFSIRNFFFPSQAAVLFVSNPRGAVPSPAARAHRTALPRAPSPAADGELWLPPRM